MKLSDAPPWLTFEALRDEIERYTFRPGWCLSVFLDRHEGPCLYVEAKVVDAYHRDQMVDLRIRSNIPPMATTAQFGEWLLWRLMQIDIHETRELLWYKGAALRDPHDPIEPEPSDQPVPWSVRARSIAPKILDIPAGDNMVNFLNSAM